MKTITDQLSTYKSVHLNGNNVKTHFVGVPLILWSIALILDMFALLVLESDELQFASHSYKLLQQLYLSTTYCLTVS